MSQCLYPNFGKSHCSWLWSQLTKAKYNSNCCKSALSRHAICLWAYYEGLPVWTCVGKCKKIEEMMKTAIIGVVFWLKDKLVKTGNNDSVDFEENSSSKTLCDQSTLVCACQKDFLFSAGMWIYFVFIHPWIKQHFCIDNSRSVTSLLWPF